MGRDIGWSLHKAVMMKGDMPSCFLLLCLVAAQGDPGLRSSPDTFEGVRVLQTALTGEEVAQLEQMPASAYEHGVACCGYWADEGAVRLHHRVAEELHVGLRRLGDVHLENASTSVHAADSKLKDWGAIAVVYLDESSTQKVRLKRPHSGTSEVLEVGSGTMVIVPQGFVLLHSRPLRVAWTRIRQPSAPSRGFFEFYIASWVQRNFVTPYDTSAQRNFFRAHTTHPRYWHGFIWSFIGTFCTVFACMPIAWWGIQMLAALNHSEELPAQVADAGNGSTRTLLPQVGKRSSLSSAIGKFGQSNPAKPWSQGHQPRTSGKIVDGNAGAADDCKEPRSQLEPGASP